MKGSSLLVPAVQFGAFPPPSLALPASQTSPTSLHHLYKRPCRLHLLPARKLPGPEEKRDTTGLKNTSTPAASPATPVSVRSSTREEVTTTAGGQREVGAGSGEGSGASQLDRPYQMP